MRQSILLYGLFMYALLCHCHVCTIMYALAIVYALLS